MVKPLAIIAIVIGVFAGVIAGATGHEPDEFEFIRLHSEWETKRTSNILYGTTLSPEPTLDDTRPWISRNPFVFGAGTSAAVFVVGLLVIISNNSQPKTARPREEAYETDADLFEDFDDPDDLSDAIHDDTKPFSRVRVNPRRKDKSERKT